MNLITIFTYKEKEYEDEGLQPCANKTIRLNIDSVVSIEHTPYDHFYLVKTMRPDLDLLITEVEVNNILHAIAINKNN